MLDNLFCFYFINQYDRTEEGVLTDISAYRPISDIAFAKKPQNVRCLHNVLCQ